MIKHLRGIVRDGVIVPDELLPEGYLAYITAGPPHFTPEEAEEFGVWRQAGARALEKFEESLTKDPTFGPASEG